MKQPSKDLTQGSLWKNIFVFSIPLMLSNVLQVLFNMSDIAVVGRFAGPLALGSVGSTAILVTMFTGFLIGLAGGINVLTALYLGAGKKQALSHTVHSALIVSICSGLALLLFGICFARPVLEILHTKEELIDGSVLYLRIYFLGMPFFMVYNFGASILRSMGDTKRPLYCLVAAGMINTVLNLLLVIVFKMSVAGVAIGTVVANMFSAGVIIYILRHEKGPFKLDIKHLQITRPELRKVLQIGVPAGIQGMVFSIANIFIQAAVNRFGSAAIAGSAAALTYEYYCYFVVSAFSQAAVTFISQNYGAGQIERCKRIFRLTMLLSVACCGLLNVLFVWQKHFAISFFTSSPEVFHYAALRMNIVLLTQCLACSYEIAGAALRGLGYSMLPAILTVFGTCVLRLLWIYLVCPLLPGFDALMVIYPISWIVTGAAVLVAYYVVQKKLFRPKEMPIFA